VNRQLHYIIQGSLPGLMIPIGGFLVKKISSPINVIDRSAVTIDDERPIRETHLEGAAYKGKMIFMQKCAACHNLFKDVTGPSIPGSEQRGPWSDRQSLYAWIGNPSEFMKKNSYARA